MAVRPAASRSAMASLPRSGSRNVREILRANLRLPQARQSVVQRCQLESSRRGDFDADGPAVNREVDLESLSDRFGAHARWLEMLSPARTRPIVPAMRMLPTAVLPFLHTWSLAVEEQYYLLFPPVFVLLMRLGRRRALIGLCVAALASFALCEVAAVRAPTANFFLVDRI